MLLILWLIAIPLDLVNGPSSKAPGITNRTSGLFFFTASRAGGFMQARDILQEPVCKILVVALALASKLQGCALSVVRDREVRPQECQLLGNIGHA